MADASAKDDFSNLLVAVRVRPLWKKESSIGCKNVVRVVEEKLVVILDPTEGEDYLRANRSREKQFAFDQVFDDEASQQKVFVQTAEHLIPYVLQGYNGSVFAYGATGAGKTYTMLGTETTPGVMYLTLQKLFFDIEARTDSVAAKVTLSYLEVYNECIRDLLKPNSGQLDLREDPIKGISVSNITEYPATSADEVISLLQQGNRRRTTEATGANETSSRSHAVLQIVIEQKERLANVSADVLLGKLSLIDLAGSERATVTQNSGKRMVEGANINRSLLALANCINALGDKTRAGAFVPYRDSKLTRLLKDSLGGDCRTVMIANISPSSNQFEETVNTLKYANRAKNIKIAATKKVKNVSYHIAEYQKIISELRAEIFELKKQLSSSISSGAGPSELSETSEESVEIDLTRSQLLRQRRNSLEELKNLNKLQADLVEVFEDRIQIRRSLIELNDTNYQNKMEISAIENRIRRKLESTENPEIIRQLQNELDIIRYNVMKNEELKSQFMRRLQENESDKRELLEDFPIKITRQERVRVLELLVKTQELEMGNMELELQLELRNKVILDQRRILQEHGLDSQIRYDVLEFDFDDVGDRTGEKRLLQDANATPPSVAAAPQPQSSSTSSTSVPPRAEPPGRRAHIARGKQDHSTANISSAAPASGIMRPPSSEPIIPTQQQLRRQDSTTLARPSSTNGTGETESKPRVGRVKGRRRTNSSARLADDGDGEAGMPSSNSASNIHVLSVNKSADFSKGPKEQTPHGGSHPISSGRRPSKGQLPQLLPLHSQR
eukprot:TRINITY_DN9291_c0_g1_i1.p1 TRINITY_DN9291_c0_g1~~TRINITY_DN9291_c0_g1_i1.p1  ORF type:complete len:787 (-),score=169.65 TRINITY_DN9291_c0_g1_i1:285-2645(-)